MCAIFIVILNGVSHLNNLRQEVRERWSERETRRGASEEDAFYMHAKDGLFSFCFRFAYKMTDWVVDGGAPIQTINDPRLFILLRVRSRSLRELLAK